MSTGSALMSSQAKPVVPPILLVLTTLTVLWHVVTIAQLPTWFGIFIPQASIRATSLVLAAVLILLTSHAASGHEGEPLKDGVRFRWLDLLVFAPLAAGCSLVIFNYDKVLDYGFFGALDTTGVILALCVAVPLLELVRRKTGIVLPIIILSFVAIAMFQAYLPGVLHGRGYSLDRLRYSSYVGESGIFGAPLGIAVNIVMVYLLFGALMERAGASRWFMDLALSLTGRSSGGPAKASVVASAMFGSISGSPSGNAATTGVFTIPMMREVGYKPSFAAAVEAVASTGGMILPPVMGAIAFLMAEWIGRTYREVVIAALIPAILYFIVIFASVHFEAKRSGIRAMARTDLPAFWKTLRSGWYYALPMLALIWFLIIAALPPGMAGIYCCGVVLLCSFLSPDRSRWLLPRPLLLAMKDAVMRWLVIVVITASVGIMIGAMELSGVGLNVSRFIVDIGGGNLVVTLVLVGAVSLLIGMGLDATPAYVTLATLMAPALIQMGVQDIAAHLFVVYWGLASFFTPPTCIAIFVTAPMAGASVWAAGWQAVRLGIAAFLVPMSFALNPALLMEGAVREIILATGTALVGAVALSAGLRGFALQRLSGAERALISLGGVLLIAPGIAPALIGLGLVVGVVVWSTWLQSVRPVREGSP
ncbi:MULTISPECIES: TRAP transporter fused permease subunit [Chelativorans]